MKRTAQAMGCCDILKSCVQIAIHYGWSLLGIVNETWERVRQRDWVTYPATGLPPRTENAAVPLC